MNYSRNSRMSLSLSLLAALALSVPIWAQKPAPCPAPKATAPGAYRLDFTVRQLRNGRVINERQYDLTVAVGVGDAYMRSQNRVTASTDKDGQYKTYEIGFNLGARLIGPQELGPKRTAPVLQANVNISSLEGGKIIPPSQPVVREIIASMSAVVRPNVPIPLATIGDVSTGDQYEITVVAIPQRP